MVTDRNAMTCEYMYSTKINEIKLKLLGDAHREELAAMRAASESINPMILVVPTVPDVMCDCGSNIL